MRTMRTKFLIAVVLPFVFGCGSRITFEPLPYGHPANPEAPEGMIAPVGETLTHSADSSDLTSGDHQQPVVGHHHGMAVVHEKSEKASSSGSGSFTCSMHRQINLNKPGRCPICGMKLIRKQPENGEGNHAH